MASFLKLVLLLQFLFGARCFVLDAAEEYPIRRKELEEPILLKETDEQFDYSTGIGFDAAEEYPERRKELDEPFVHSTRHKNEDSQQLKLTETEKCRKIAKLDVTIALMQPSTRQFSKRNRGDFAAVIQGLLKSLTDSGSPTVCDVLTKLDEMYTAFKREIIELSKQVSALSCSLHEAKIFENIMKPLNYLQDAARAFKSTNDARLKTTFVELCASHTVGISKLMSDMKSAFLHYLPGIINDCVQYKSKPLRIYSQIYQVLVAQTLVVYAECVEAGESDIVMNITQFVDDYSAFFGHLNCTASELFFKDTTQLGMSRVLESVAYRYTRNSEDCKNILPATRFDMAQVLKENYDFWDWNVDTFYGTDWANGHDYKFNDISRRLNISYKDGGFGAGSENGYFRYRENRCTTIISYYSKAPFISQEHINHIADQVVVPTFQKYEISGNNSYAKYWINPESIQRSIMNTIEEKSLTDYFRLVHVAYVEALTPCSEDTWCHAGGRAFRRWSDKNNRETLVDDMIFVDTLSYFGGERLQAVASNHTKMVRSGVKNHVVYFFKGPRGLYNPSQQMVYLVTIGVVPITDSSCPIFEGFKTPLFFSASSKLDDSSKIIRTLNTPSIESIARHRINTNI